jgi:L-ascorbate metabolism protein UlaG (beta-lactamase superfamily)
MSLQLIYYGHATCAFELDGSRIVVDPFFAPNNPATNVRANDVAADFILQTHGHGDHIADTVALAQRTGATVICVPEIAGWLKNKGVAKTHGMNTGGAYSFPFGRVSMVVAHHSSGLPDGSYGGNPVGFVVHFNSGHDIYIAGDTALTYDMRLIGESGGVDLALLPIGDNYTMGPEDAITAAQWVQAKRVVPVHYNTWPLVAQDGAAFAERLRRVAEIDCTVMQPGDTFEL